MSPVFVTSPELGGAHGFFTRRGGVSTGPYAGLNCSLSGGDDPARVARNRGLVEEAIGTLAGEPVQLVGVTQVHGNEVVRVETPWPPGSGPRADALVTDRPGVALGIITADCAPVLFRDGVRGIVGAAHAGWRGAAGGVLEATVAAMRRLGSAPADIRASVGPCIGQASYEVGADLRDAVLPTLADAQSFFLQGTRPDRWQFDLAGYCLARLAAHGVQGVAIGLDTCSDSGRFFSHRRRTLDGEGPIGHQISVITP